MGKLVKPLSTLVDPGERQEELLKQGKGGNFGLLIYSTRVKLQPLEQPQPMSEPHLVSEHRDGEEESGFT